MNPSLRKTRAALVAALYCAHVSLAQALTLPGMPYSYQAQGKKLETVLSDFSSQLGISLALSAHIDGVVQGDFNTATYQEFIEKLASRYGFVWYVHANTLFVSNARDVSTKIIALSSLSPGELRSALTSLGLLENKFGWGELPERKMVFISGPASYVGLIAVTTQELVAATQEQRTLASVPMPEPVTTARVRAQQRWAQESAARPIVPAELLPPLPSGTPGLPVSAFEARPEKTHPAPMASRVPTPTAMAITSFEQTSSGETAWYEPVATPVPARKTVVALRNANIRETVKSKPGSRKNRAPSVDLDDFVKRLALENSPSKVTAMAQLGSMPISPPANTPMTELGARDLVLVEPQQLAQLSSAQLKVLSAKQVAALTPAQVKALSPLQVAALGAKVDALSARALSSLSPAQFNAIDSVELNRLSDAQWDTVIAARMSTIAPVDLATLSPAQLTALSEAHISGMTAQQISVLSPQQIAAIGPKLGRLSPAAAGALQAHQIAAVAPTDLSWMSPRMVQVTHPTRRP